MKRFSLTINGVEPAVQERSKDTPKACLLMSHMFSINYFSASEVFQQVTSDFEGLEVGNGKVLKMDPHPPSAN
jgi:hypothetical protein